MVVLSEQLPNVFYKEHNAGWNTMIQTNDQCHEIAKLVTAKTTGNRDAYTRVP